MSMHRRTAGKQNHLEIHPQETNKEFVLKVLLAT